MKYKFIFLIIILSIFLISNHMMDIENSQYDRGFTCEVRDNLVYSVHGKTYTTNGFFNMDTNIQYHLYWYISYTCFFIIFIMIILDIDKWRK